MAQKKDNTKTLIVVAFLIALGVGSYFWLRGRKKESDILKDVFDNLNFETGKSIIKDTSFPYLDDLVGVLKKAPNWQLEIIGHTDNQGSDKFNLELSKMRADAVKNYLGKSGITNVINATGFGESKPIADNNTPEGREKNRRVEFVIKKPDNTTITKTK